MLNKIQIEEMITNDIMVKYSFEQDGLAMFLAQCDHESMGFNRTDENLNYSSKRLLQIFGKYFRESNVQRYANKPVAIANKIYANRMGNGDELSGDGYNYRGRGYIQLTGQDNYKKCGDDLTIDLLNYPNIVATSKYALLSSLWYFKVNKLINCTDCGKVTKIINGGLNGLKERQSLYNNYREVLKNE